MRFLPLVLLGLMAACEAPDGLEPPQNATVLFGDRTVSLREAIVDADDLWVRPTDLPRVNGFELKPEGACIDAFCIPVSEDGADPMLRTLHGAPWFSVTALARRLEQSVVSSPEERVFSLGPLTFDRQAYLASAVAPDFELPDRSGNTVRLSDFKGKKVLLLTWASW